MSPLRMGGHVGNAVLRHECGMGRKVCGLTMNGHANGGFGPLVHLLQLVAARVAGDVDQRFTVENDLYALIDERVLDVEDQLLVARNGAGRENHHVAGRERGVAVIVTGQLGERGAGFALRTGEDDDQLLARHRVELVFGKERGDAVEITELARHVAHPQQRAAQHHDLATCGLSSLRDGADAADIGREGGNEHPALRSADNGGERVGHLLLGRTGALAQCVRGIADEGEYALFAETSEMLLVRRLAERRCVVDLPVAGVDDVAQR